MTRQRPIIQRNFKYFPIVYFVLGAVWILATNGIVTDESHAYTIYLSFTLFLSISSWLLYLGITRSIAERKKTEEKLRQTQQDLADAIREQQGFIFKYVKEGDKFIHVLCDGQLLSKVGLTPELVLGKTITEIFLQATDERRAQLHDYYSRAWDGEIITFEMTALNGLTLYATLRPVRIDGVVTAVIGSCVDITERKASEEMLLKSEKLSIVGQLAAGVAHEIRNPLTSIKGFLQIISPKEEHRHFHEIMLSEIDRVEEIIREFLFLAKPQQRNYQKQDINHLLQSVVTLFEPQALLNNIQIKALIPSEPKMMECEANHLKQVFINVLKNAMESMASGGIISISVTGKENSITIQFTDEGCGIPTERLNLLGEPFYTTKQKGSGLGLMVSYKIIEQHKGSIAIDSKLDEGTTVNITLPLNASQSLALA
ncbi:PAS domain-containing sensor histidine kinase [Ammoniphilus sp. CFH 90114]|uniref:PAS domain-containing sensor histidine kinase n=1 Tax=Ammoniphilus sp. CFH 90114 TaxID=2493665 RepID=UPI00100F3F91|nr:PAS domain-containing sensor histidine kinase [Ammoniphilus sp. CFH 90114]RXT04824.1 PAS domain-containing sensor histidine kinase [Ammoniphilus sp. CFH 90114]